MLALSVLSIPRATLVASIASHELAPLESSEHCSELCRSGAWTEPDRHRSYGQYNKQPLFAFAHADVRG
jgi:hypothetical protein